MTNANKVLLKLCFLKKSYYYFSVSVIETIHQFYLSGLLLCTECQFSMDPTYVLMHVRLCGKILMPVVLMGQTVPQIKGCCRMNLFWLHVLQQLTIVHYTIKHFQLIEVSTNNKNNYGNCHYQILLSKTCLSDILYGATKPGRDLYGECY